MAITSHEDEIPQILTFLHKKTGIDFSEYKVTSIQRRIQRRCILNKIEDFKEYYDFLRRTPQELGALQKDLLITVTRFFRDPEKFAALESTVFPVLVKNHADQEDPIRMWVAGTSTGEETYSIAIEITEFLEKNKKEIPVQIFATDISKIAIEKARAGIYLADIKERVSQQRLRRFFTETEGGYQISKEIREMCVFAVHDLAHNPPFSNLDFISCLNVFIYLNPTLQKKVLSLFHYALKSPGYLMVGNSESISVESNLFHAVSAKHKIYAKKDIQPEPFLHEHLKNSSQTVAPPMERIQETNHKGLNHTINRMEKINRLRETVALTQEYSTSLIDELEKLTEELESKNEELIINNEELQTVNEELESSQEELQSANEELMSLNTELQRREEAKSRLAAIVESSEDAILSKTLQGIITSWNATAERLFQYTAKEAVGKHIFLIVPPERRKEENEIINKLQRGIRIEHFETVRQRKDGKRVDVSLTISPVKNDAGRIIGVSKVARDITDRKQQEKAEQFLAEASATLSSYLDIKKILDSVAKLTVPQFADWAIIDLVNEGNEIERVSVIHTNKRFKKHAETLKKNYPPNPSFREGVPQVIRTGQSSFTPHVTRAFLKKASQNQEHYELLTKLGFTSGMCLALKSRRTVLGAVTLIYGPSGRVYTHHDFTVAQELARRIALILENARLYSDAQKAIALRDDFISVASHELKTPVTSMKIYLQMLEKRFQKNGEKTASAYLGKMNQQVDNLITLVNDLLDVSRLEQRELVLQYSTFDLNELMHEAVENVQATTKQHNLSIKGSIQHNLNADRFRMYQVLINLLTNAVKYSPRSKKINITLAKKKGQAVISVQDFGIGIDKKYQPNIFKRFYQVGNPEEKAYSGLGMGLYISYEIIRRHGGTISFTSKKGKGSTFTFSVPLNRDGRN